MAHRKVLRQRHALVALALAALWTTIIVLGAAYSFWRPLITVRGDSQAFARAAAEIIDRDLVGNTEPRLVCRRLQLLSRMEHHEQDNEQVFP